MVRFGRPLRGNVASAAFRTDSGLSAATLHALDRGVGTLHVRGELKGYLASILGEMRFPPGRPWPWFVVVWPDGRKENAFEDYGPTWPIVRELEAGSFDHFGPSVKGDQKFLGLTIQTMQRGAPCLYDFAWLPRSEAAEKWVELGLLDSDF
jgi:hypothetical protein